MIKFFKKIRDGINHLTHCPFCHSELFINEKEHSISQKKGHPILTFNLIGEDLLHININTDEIIVDLNQTISSHGYFNYGTNYHGINIECTNVDCSLFDFTIQLQTNLDKNKINHIILNSERVSYEDKEGMLHEIKNVYTNNTTEYTFYTETESKTKKIPLVPLDFSDPEHTIQRIKKLIIFS